MSPIGNDIGKDKQKDKDDGNDNHNDNGKDNDNDNYKPSSNGDQMSVVGRRWDGDTPSAPELLKCQWQISFAEK